LAVVTPVQALQKALAAEHAALHLYDQLTVLVSAKGADPVAAKIDYEAPGPTGTAAEIEAVARTIEKRMTLTYGELVAHTAGADRQWAIRALDASALRELGFGVRPAQFPGLG
jgi:hypothetical protein